MGAVSARQVKIQGGFKHSLSSPGPEINEKNTFVVLKYYLKKKNYHSGTANVSYSAV